VVSSPAVVGGLVYVGSYDKKVYCLDAATGALVWSYTTGGRVESSPAVVNGVVYVGSDDGRIYAFARAPILIYGDSEFVPANGVTKGSGTASDPYIIEGWAIDASTADGICISNTTKYFIIRNVFVHDGGSDYFYGIYLSNVTNGQVLNVNTTRNSVGIALDSFSLNNVVSGNNVTNNDWGIYIWSSNGTTVSGNEVTHNCIGNGISLDSSSDNTVSGNEVAYSGDIGVYLVDSSSCNTISGNTITSNNRGIMLDTSSNDNAVFGNTITSASGREGSGISLDRDCRDNSVSGNNITANTGDGLDISNSSSNSFSGNSIANNGVGVSLDSSSSSNIFSENNITNNGQGIWLDSSSNNAIYHNNFINNTGQAYSPGSTNVWDDGYPSGGNFWSDYTGVDLCNGPYQNVTGSDGVGDTPYVIDSNNKDNYPLMGSFSSLNGISTVSNSTISGLQFSGATISFNVTGPPGTTGFCTLTIPYSTLPPPYIVTVDSNPIQYTTIFENDTISIIYFTYQHSTHEVTITRALSSGAGGGGRMPYMD
jgi:parallel beta-helix repeat protein